MGGVYRVLGGLYGPVWGGRALLWGGEGWLPVIRPKLSQPYAASGSGCYPRDALEVSCIPDPSDSLSR